MVNTLRYSLYLPHDRVMFICLSNLVFSIVSFLTHFFIFFYLVSVSYFRFSLILFHFLFSYFSSFSSINNKGMFFIFYLFFLFCFYLIFRFLLTSFFFTLWFIFYLVSYHYLLLPNLLSWSFFYFLSPIIFHLLLLLIFP